MSPVKSRLLSQNTSGDSKQPEVTHAVSTIASSESEPSSHPPSTIAVSPDSDPLYILDPSAHQRDGVLASYLHLRELELMHHYATVSYKTISNRETFSTIFQTVVPKEALAHPFLMHGILSLSALHLVQLNKGTEQCQIYAQLATGQQTLALALFRKELNNITPINCHALFAFSSIATVLAFAFSQASEVQTLSPIDEMLQIFYLCRGISEILQTAKEWIRESWVGVLLTFDQKCDPTLVPQEVRDKINQLAQINKDTARTGLSPEEKEACGAAITEMMDCFDRIYSDWDHVTIFRWPILVGPLFLSLVRDRQPMALVIMGHYCVALHTMNDRWWLAGCTHQLLKSIYSELNASWKEVLTWPIKAVELFA
jgi:hypothetical protein